MPDVTQHQPELLPDSVDTDAIQDGAVTITKINGSVLGLIMAGI